jgi:uncharacterized damage-inducible protein DinB
MQTTRSSPRKKFPDDKYTVKLGTQRETRTFAALIGHVIKANYFYCSIAKGEADPQTKDYEKNPGTKAEMATAMQAAIDYCTPIYDVLTDANAMEMVYAAGSAGSRTGKSPAARRDFDPQSGPQQRRVRQHRRLLPRQQPGATIL